MVFSVYKRQASNVNDFLSVKSHVREKPLFEEYLYSVFEVERNYNQCFFSGVLATQT